MSPSARYTLLTGATGQLGRHLLADLLRSGLPTAVLTRGSAESDAAARIDRLLGDLESQTGRRLPRPVVLEGDLTQPGLGLSQPSRRWLREHVVRVVHSAASLSFKPAASHPDNEPFRTNVDGLHGLLAVLDEADIREMHAISTAYVCGLGTGRIAEQLAPRPDAFANDYEDSKWQAEQILSTAGTLRSLTITRPSIVIDSHDRAARSDRTIYSTLATLKMLMGQFGAGRAEDWTGLLQLDGSERKNLIEATWAARVTVEILRHRRLHDRVYHLTDPSGTSIGGMTAAFHSALVGAGQFKATASGPTSNATLDAMAAGFVQTFAPYFRDDPTFARVHTEEAIAATAAEPAPTIDQRTLQTLAERMIAADRPAARESNASVEDETEAKSFLQSAAVDATADPLWPEDIACGLLVYGRGGGDWALDRSGRLTVGGGAATCRLHITSDALSEVCRDPRTGDPLAARLDAALRSLDASIECDDDRLDAVRVREMIEHSLTQLATRSAELRHVSV